MEKDYDFNRLLIEDLYKKLESLSEESNLQSVEHYEKQLDIVLDTLRGAYDKNQNEHAKNISKDIEDLILVVDEAIKKSGGTVDVQEHKKGLEKRIEEYNTIVKEDRLLPKGELCPCGDEEEKKESKIRLRNKPYQDRFFDYKVFDDFLTLMHNQLKGLYNAKNIYDNLKTLMEHFHRKRKLDEESIIELEKIIDRSCNYDSKKFGNMKKSYDHFKKDVLE